MRNTAYLTIRHLLSSENLSIFLLFNNITYHAIRHFIYSNILFTPLYNFFNKKLTYRPPCCIIRLQTNTQERGVPYVKLIIQRNNIIGRFYRYFFAYFKTFSAPTIETLFLLVLSILAMESADSIRFLYKHFLSGITEKSLNAFYYACSYAKVDYSNFVNVTASMVLKLIPNTLSSQPIFLCINDTMVAKFGKKFEQVSVLFDHAAHNGSNYLNGRCFVSLLLCVPV